MTKKANAKYSAPNVNLSFRSLVCVIYLCHLWEAGLQKEVFRYGCFNGGKRLKQRKFESTESDIRWKERGVMEKQVTNDR